MVMDNAIVKALECCGGKGGECGECPYEGVKDCDCEDLLLRNALDLIKRQQAEIDRLTDDNKDLNARYLLLDLGVASVRAEAHKEFAEQLKLRFIASSLQDTIDEIIKEMTEGDIDG